MPKNEERKYERVINYIEDGVGLDVDRDLLKVALRSNDSGTLGTNIAQIGGTPQSAVNVADQIDKIQNILSGQTLTVTDDGSLAIATLPEPIDVSSSEVDVDLNSQSVSPITITDDGSLAIAAWNAGTLEVNDTGKGVITDTTTSTGSGSAAQLDLGDNRKDVDVFYDTSGSATVTIEVSKNASDWRQFNAENPTSAKKELIQMDTSYRHVRAYADQNLNRIELSSKGE